MQPGWVTAGAEKVRISCMCQCDSDCAKLSSSEYKMEIDVSIENQKILFPHLHHLVGFQKNNNFNREKKTNVYNQLRISPFVALKFYLSIMKIMQAHCKQFKQEKVMP